MKYGGNKQAPGRDRRFCTETCLTGFMGIGKSVVGRCWPAARPVDTDCWWNGKPD